MNCTHCGKRLSRKSARLIDGVVMCSKCMFTPAKQRKTLAVIETASADQTVGLGPQGESANSSEYSLNTLEATMTPNETSPDQAVEAAIAEVNSRFPDWEPTPDMLGYARAVATAIPTPPPASNYPICDDVTCDGNPCRASNDHASPRELEWQPRIGEEVRVASHIADQWPDWREMRLWVVGVQKRRMAGNYPHDGLEVTVSEEWPVTVKTTGYTDDFYIGRASLPDDLESARTALELG